MLGALDSGFGIPRRAAVDIRSAPSPKPLRSTNSRTSAISVFLILAHGVPAEFHRREAHVAEAPRARRFAGGPSANSEPADGGSSVNPAKQFPLGLPALCP
jgi:hypothetical protein